MNMKVMKIIKNIITGILLFTYFGIIIFVSVLLLNRNDFGVTQFGDKTLILISEEISNDKYPKNSLAIVESKKIEELQPGQEVFVYKTNETDKTIDITVSNIATTTPAAKDNSAYITLENNGGSWGEDYIAGISTKVYSNIGGVLSFLESKWIFFLLLIVPCFFILIYEIYLAIIEIKYGDLEDENMKAESEVKDKSNDTGTDSNTLEELKKQIEKLQKEVANQQAEKVNNNISENQIQPAVSKIENITSTEIASQSPEKKEEKLPQNKVPEAIQKELDDTIEIL